uniref:Uncharacterized protein n=1 Tax=Plectus sambesii TaxID=2011161 RepID=A0A914VW04_9BILA
MADYRLRRAHSATIIPRSRSFVSPATSNLTQDRYKPHWQPSTYYRYIRGEALCDDAWSQKSHIPSGSPYYAPPSFTVHRFDSDGTASPIHVPSYRPGYSGYCFREYPRYGRKYQDRFYEWDSKRPYHSPILDSMSDSSDRGIFLYRYGCIPYSSIDGERLTNRSYARRFRTANNVYTWDKSRYAMPTFFDRESIRYFTNWP